METTPTLKIGQLAQASGVPAKTIRFYEEAHLLPPAARAENGYRLYAAEDVERLRFIRSARGLDFSLDDLREVLALRDHGEPPCRAVVNLLQEKSAEIEARIEQLRRLQQELAQLQAQAAQLPDDDIDMKHCVCHLIRSRAG
ncbi:MAG: heavy metal-responsive transcriptional regulator [Chloroflexi bacterium]|nr:MAG: heavy metal-responsive transcriptional regulator [Chloroflexota bacterium]